jgi:hypothetical protein
VGHPRRWVLANVAVLPEAQNQGVATGLVGATIDLARGLGARELLLQVKRDNDTAIHLYEKMGFRRLCTRTAWVRRRFAPSPTPRSGLPIRGRKPEEWRDQLELARRLHPEGLEWPYPVQAGQFRPRPFERFFGMGKQHWLWVEDGDLLASLSINSGLAGPRRRFILIADPRARGRVEGPMIGHALRDLSWEGGVVLDYPAGAAIEAFSDLGFEALRTLTWMGRQL